MMNVLFAAAWMHDLGVFLGPPAGRTGGARRVGQYRVCHEGNAESCCNDLSFPVEKIPAVIEAIRTHLPSTKPTSFEGTLLRDADILEQLGAVGILRTVSKVGRDTRFVRFDDALRALRRNAEQWPALLELESAAAARRSARENLEKRFWKQAEAEAGGKEFVANERDPPSAF